MWKWKTIGMARRPSGLAVVVVAGVLAVFTAVGLPQPSNHHLNQPTDSDPAAPPAATLLLKQARDGVPGQHLTAAELATLGDPLFILLLRDHADVVEYDKVEDLIQPDKSKRQTFVVEEHIADAARSSRRAVVAFTGTVNGQVLDSNVMLSIAFDAQKFPSPPSI